MAFDKTQPTNTTKLRNLGTVIRPNWVAIEEAEDTFVPQALNLKDRTAAGLVNDPTAITEAMILYSKQDGAGKPQAYAIDPDSNVIQLTAGLPIAAETGTSNLPGGIIIKWGVCSSNGAGIVNNFVTAFPNACWVVVPIGENIAALSNAVKPGTFTVNGFTATSSEGEVGHYIAIGN